MFELSNVSIEDPVFWFCAISGTGLFIIQFFFSFLWGDASHDHDGNYDGHDAGFKWLSKHGLTGFLMMFGWIGLTCCKQFEFGRVSTTVLSLVGGILSLFIVGLIFKGVSKLRSLGTVFSIEGTIGKQATIYQQISFNGIGKISVIFDGLTYEIDATSRFPETLEPFTKVKIIEKLDEKTVIVVPI